jgi:hypothetical protein
MVIELKTVTTTRWSTDYQTGTPPSLRQSPSQKQKLDASDTETPRKRLIQQKKSARLGEWTQT